MSQHSQLAAGSGIVPADGQVGNALSGPIVFGPSSRPQPRSVATIGVEPSSFLRRAILWRAFGVAEVKAIDPAGWLDSHIEAPAVILHHLADPPAWDRLLDWAGDRTVVVDVQIAATMAAAAGHDLRVETAAGSVEPALAVMCHAEDRAVYPLAPAVEICAAPPVSSGFTVGDRVHLYAPAAIDPAIRVLADNEGLTRFAEQYKASIWGRETQTHGVALLTCRTPAGGLVSIVDLHTVDRTPEPSGSETPAIQIFLSLLGRSPVSFGRFVVPYAHYSEFVDVLTDITRRHSRFAAMDRIGRSGEGHDICLLKIAREPGLPVVLLTSAIHPYEWGPIYGILRYLRFLLERLDAGGFEAEELLAHHQIWWVPSACPDGFENRQQQPTGINLNRNFAGAWDYAAPGQVHWGSFGRPHSIEEILPISLRGPAPGSQPESRALMSLFERDDGRIVTLADFHESTGTQNFLHQFEDENGVIADVEYHAELLEGIGQAFGDRFFEQRESFQAVEHHPDFNPGRACSWLGYAVMHGAKGCVVESEAGDCTHYRTVHRTEYAAQVVEQVLAAELGRLFRNPWGEDREVTLTLPRRPEQVVCRLYDADGVEVEETVAERPEKVTRTVPRGGCLRLRYE